MKNNLKFKYFDSDDFVEDSAEVIKKLIENLLKNKEKISIALSGGNSPLPIYKKLIQYNLQWDKISFFLVDERCVSNSSNQSNYGNIKKSFGNHTSLNIFPIIDESTPFIESANRYQKLILENVFIANDIPRFDLIILGMGIDGHIASLFPDTKALTEKDKFIVLNEVPQLNSKRITMTYPLIENAKKIILISKGKEKKAIILKAQNLNLPISRLLTNIDLILN